jgi:2'-5' RNA ligase
VPLLRAFLACELPLALQHSIQSVIDDLRLILGDDLVRWVPAYNIHLTLKFLGDISPLGVDSIEHMLTISADNWKAFDVRIGGLGSFPGSRRPRVLWIGMQAPASLASLQHDLESASARLGYKSEERPFSPHLTIGRVRQTVASAGLRRIEAALSQSEVGELGIAHVDAIHLFKSDLQPTGPVYSKLLTASLR